jgi:hypothetical protein
VIGLLRRGGAWAAARPMNRITVEGNYFLKERTPLGELAAAASRALPLPFVVLSGDAWFAREAALYAALHGLSVGRRGGLRGALVLPALPGERLDRCAASLALDAGAPGGRGRVERACASAFASLEALHALREPHASGPGRPLSHADAHARNALYEEATGRVSFFDFETVHPATLTVDQRHADDLLALASSLAAALGAPWHGPLARLVASAHGGRLRQAALALGRAPPGPIALARAPMSEGLRRGWAAALEAALRA